MRNLFILSIAALTTLLTFRLCYPDSYTMTVDCIKDSASLIEKIRNIEDPLYKYFETTNVDINRDMIIEVINTKVLENPNFAYEVTKEEELRNIVTFKEMMDEEKEKIVINNSNLLNELYPNEIIINYKKKLTQGFKLKVNKKVFSDTMWIKTEIIKLFNEILKNKNVTRNWTNLQALFDNSVSENEIKEFMDNINKVKIDRIPINGLSIKKTKKGIYQISIKDKEKQQKIKLIQVLLISNKKWKIIDIKDAINKLDLAGYIEMNEASND